MRHEAFLLTRVESLALISAVDLWCRRTGTNYNKLVAAAQVNTSVRSDVRHNGRALTKETGARLTLAMAENPRGISRDDHRARIRVIAVRRLERQRQRTKRDFPAEPIRVDRSPCPRCGVRRDIGCKHFERTGSIDIRTVPTQFAAASRPHLVRLQNRAMHEAEEMDRLIESGHSVGEAAAEFGYSMAGAIDAMKRYGYERWRDARR